MKTRANLNFFLSKRGGSLRRFCEINNIRTKSELLGVLDDACVAHPEELQLKDLFSDRRKVANKQKVVQKEVQKPALQPALSDKDEVDNASASSKKSRRSSRKRSARARSSSASEE